MKIQHIVKYLFLSQFFLFTSFSIYPKDNFTFDYTSMSLNSVGIYNPAKEGEKTGLNAELIARKNGLDNLEKYFETYCEGFDKSTLNVKSDWEDNFHSQGTEIYANGVLAVTLQAPIKQIFKISSKSKKIIKTDEGEKIHFLISDPVPLSAIRCGTLEINLGGKNNIHAIPMDLIKSTSKNIKIIHLVFNKNSSTLELDPLFKEKDTDILENSTLADLIEANDISSEILPISLVNK